MGNLKTVIIGSNGQLGTDLLRVFDETDIIAVTHQDLDITDADGVDAFMKETAPSAVVNTAAYHHTGKCEANPVNAFEVNAVGALNLARACERSKSLLVHVSTDYVFDGDKCTPYVETDPAVPLSVYGLSKLAGELAVMSYCPENYVLRTCGLYGLVPCRAKGDNFITKIRRLAAEKGEVTVVDDEIVTPTWTFSFARHIKRLCDEFVVRVHTRDFRADVHEGDSQTSERRRLPHGASQTALLGPRERRAEVGRGQHHGRLARVARALPRACKELTLP
jgi:dTDP-4-dehydrorhamnose reductase